MGDGEAFFQKYINHVEGLISSYAIQVLKVQENHEAITKTMTEIKEGNTNLQRDIQEVGKGVDATTNELKRMNGSVKRHEGYIRKIRFERSRGHRIVDCPQTPEINEIKTAVDAIEDALMTENVLKEFLKAQNKRRDMKFGVWLAVATFVLGGVTLLAMFYIG